MKEARRSGFDGPSRRPSDSRYRMTSTIATAIDELRQRVIPHAAIDHSVSRGPEAVADHVR